MLIDPQVVERAQQKLKLDAMIVQQGRLTDNAKKARTTVVLLLNRRVVVWSARMGRGVRGIESQEEK